MTNTVDITPTPRILRTLGDIPFEVWQCLAELADNSLDAFRDSIRRNEPVADARVDILWSRDSVAPQDREIIIKDNGPGMTIETLQNAARAGYSNNDPIHNLGLFGMGFNIATARLGEETTFLSATKESEDWVGIVIDFADLIQNGTFAAKVVRQPKSDPEESGTCIHVKRLRDGIFGDLKSRESAIRKRLEVIYSDILQRDHIEVRLQGKTLKPHTHCAWSSGRFTIYKGQKVEAVQELDHDLGTAYFDQARNRYLNEYEIDEYEEAPERNPAVVKRQRRLRGWIGIQRYSDTTDFGIDFIRNGRKILIGDKSLFGFENPDTGTVIMEYPIELASTIGGRIVGEVHVDYLLPTYQKNGFDTSNRAWKLTVDAIRGAGPILPKQRQALGYTGDNSSPLGILVNAYRRSDPGTKCLALRRDVAKSMYAEFRKGNPDYASDDRWYKALQEEDRARGGESEDNLPSVDGGAVPSDDISNYIDEMQGVAPAAPVPAENPESLPREETSSKAELVSNSEKQASLSGPYTFDPRIRGFDISAWRLQKGDILKSGKRVPCIISQDGVSVDFFYDETHPLIDEYPITPKQLLLQVLADRFAVRDPSLSLQEAYTGLIIHHLKDERIHAPSLRERAEAVLGQIRDSLPDLLRNHTHKALEVIKATPSEVEYITNAILDKAPDLYSHFQTMGEHTAHTFAYVSEDGIITLIQNFPEVFMDNNVFKLPYVTISTGDAAADLRFKAISVEKVTTYLKDLRMMLRGSARLSKSELIRYANTLRLFEERLA